MIEEFAKKIPSRFMEMSGSVFYSGRDAFSEPCDLYVLGLNPGGDSDRQAKETIRWHTDKVLKREPRDWSAYRDQKWENKPKGTYGIQPQVLHLLDRLGYPPGKVPASNVVFPRSRGANSLVGNMRQYAEKCWVFHQTVIDKLKPRAILCFGIQSSKFVRKKVHAKKKICCFEERNKRRWRSRSYINDKGLIVIQLTHPSRADWRATAADPTDLVQRALEKRRIS